MLVSVIVPWLRELVFHLTPWIFGFDPKLVHVRFVAENMVLVLVQVQAFIQVLVIPQTLHTDLHPHVALTIRVNGRFLGT